MVNIVKNTDSLKFNDSFKLNDSVNNLSKYDNIRQDMNPVFYIPIGLYPFGYPLTPSQLFVLWNAVLIFIGIFLDKRMKAKLTKQIIFLERQYDKAIGVSKNATHYGPTAKRQRLMEEVEADHYFSPDSVDLKRKLKDKEHDAIFWKNSFHSLARRNQQLSIRLDEIDAFKREHSFTAHVRGPCGFFLAVNPSSLIRSFDLEDAKEADERGRNDYKLRHRRFRPFKETNEYWMSFWDRTGVMPPYPVNIWGEKIGRILGEVEGGQRVEYEGKLLLWSGF